MSANPALTPIIAQDSFASATGRGSPNNWSPADGGAYNWSLAVNTPTLAVTSSEGTLTGATGRTILLLSTATALNVEALVRFANAQNTDEIIIPIRSNAGASAYYFARLKSQNIGIYRYNGSENNINNVATTVTAGNFYWIRFRAVGPNLYCKIWADSGSEPSAWNVSVVDTNITSPGQFGVGTILNTSTNTIKFDHVSFSTVLAQDIVSNRHRSIGRIQ